jgi:hypothetical protein
MIKTSIFLLILCFKAFAGNSIPIKTDELEINSTIDKDLNIKVELIKESIVWKRNNDLIMEPKLRVHISTESKKNIVLRYKNQNIYMQRDSNHTFTELYYHLFDRDQIEVFAQNKSQGSISINKSKNIKTKNLVTDLSCQKYKLSIEGIDNEFFSVGCKTIKLGKVGQEKRLVKVYWKSPAFKTSNLSVAHFTSSAPVVIEVEDNSGIKKNIKISGNIPARFNRLNIAYGLGPYAFDTTFEGQHTDRNTNSFDVPIAPALMLYFNYHLTEDDSIRGFDAVVFKDSVFNNMGAYYAKNIIYLDNKQFSLTTLIGVQHLYLDFDGSKNIVNKPIFPQGLEFDYKNIFGLDGYSLGAGAFISPSDSYDYQNVWLRFGKNVFWELNYIYWGEDEFSAKMWGLSAGFFFGSFL